MPLRLIFRGTNCSGLDRNKAVYDARKSWQTSIREAYCSHNNVDESKLPKTENYVSRVNWEFCGKTAVERAELRPSGLMCDATRQDVTELGRRDPFLVSTFRKASRDLLRPIEIYQDLMIPIKTYRDQSRPIETYWGQSRRDLPLILVSKRSKNTNTKSL